MIITTLVACDSEGRRMKAQHRQEKYLATADQNFRLEHQRVEKKSLLDLQRDQNETDLALQENNNKTKVILQKGSNETKLASQKSAQHHQMRMKQANNELWRYSFYFFAFLCLLAVVTWCFRELIKFQREKIEMMRSDRDRHRDLAHGGRGMDIDLRWKDKEKVYDI